MLLIVWEWYNGTSAGSKVFHTVNNSLVALSYRYVTPFNTFAWLKLDKFDRIPPRPNLFDRTNSQPGQDCSIIASKQCKLHFMCND